MQRKMTNLLIFLMKKEDLDCHWQCQRKKIISKSGIIVDVGNKIMDARDKKADCNWKSEKLPNNKSTLTMESIIQRSDRLSSAGYT